MIAAPMQLPVDAEPAAVMVAAIAAWRELRHPRLADLVDRIEELLLAEAPRPALRASKRHADVEAWRLLEAAGDPLDFRRLAAAAGCGSKADVLRQVQALGARRDPRLARALLELLEQPPYAGAASRELLSAILEELAGTRDRRAAVPAEDLADRYLGVAPTATGRWMIDELKGVARRLEAAEHEPPAGELAAACAALEARFGVIAADPAAAVVRRTLGELLAEVYAAPDQDGPRLVCADVLLERGDPRGELIALQIARARGAITEEGRAREAELLRDRTRLAAWAQPLSTCGDCAFERGFPATIWLRLRAKVTTDHPAWATITGVRNIAHVSQAVARRICDLPNLRSVATLSVPFLEKLCRTPRPWTHVDVDGPRVPSAGALAALPELRSLELRCSEALPRDYLARLPLRELTIRTGGSCTELHLPPALVRLDVSAGGALPRMDLSRQVRLEELRLASGLPGDPLALPVLDGLVRLRKLRLESVRATLPPRALVHLTSLEELHVEAAGTTELQLEGLPLGHLSLPACPLDQFPPGLPLRYARAAMPSELEPLERFLARYPALAHLELQLVVSLDENDAPWWRRLVELLERSSLQRCDIGHWYAPNTLERDADGLLSRLRIGTGTIGEPLAHALTRVTSIESRTKLPPRLASLVR